ncbi:hypothetical protein [Mesorhizobium sp.]|uniref:hypothetical protein n=1 Tax=Mesorhizobium sp. TaxID=1871066 RepID=UPI000FE75362|nr:hypothetical protein [Mesorhizobium sp.]RWJ37462.1 MAG: hypothetical protein EOR28_01970 [Mesorhizobium sp.]RWJ41569.1 MAG: hypothetical protein EOR31_25775 [Mesorhizobium sp.]TIQ72861.1 MAG: hypothetical protein E5X40_08940 [Mesorhizobium sp.]TIX80598.1 MAG: hypothetical protein E5V24_23255 [Mesorhizobium sp.]
MTKLAKAENDQPEAAEVYEAVDPKKVIMNNNGFGWRDFLVRLPEGATADCLKDPLIWKRVQNAKGVSFVRHDHLYIVAFDDTWAAEAIVADSDAGKAIITKPRIHTFPDRFDNLFEDELYRIKWTGIGYVVERKADKAIVSHPAPNIALAERDLARLYPKVA